MIGLIVFIWLTMKSKIKKSNLLVFFLASSSILFNILTFSISDLKKFGYSKTFLEISKLEVVNGSLQSNLYNDTGHHFPEFLNYPNYYNSFREPLYPIFLKFTNFVGGLNASLMTQRFLLLLTLFLVYKSIFNIFGKKILLISWVLIAFFSSVPFFYSQVFYPYSISNFFLAAALFSYSFGRTPFYRFGTTGLFMGIASLERQQLLISIVVIVVIKVSKREKFRNVLLLVLAASVIIFPWSANNFRLEHRYSLTTIEGYISSLSYGAKIVETKSPCLGDPYFAKYQEVLLKYGADSGSLYFLGQKTVLHDLNLAKSSYELRKKVNGCILHDPQIIAKHLIRNLFHYPDRLIVFKNPLGDKKSLGGYWDNHIRSLPRFQEPGLLISILLFVIASLVLVCRYLSLSRFEEFTLALLVSSLFTIAVTINDARYRGLIDFLIIPVAVRGVVIIFSKFRLLRS